VDFYDSKSGPIVFADSPTLAPNSCQLLFMSGFPSSTWLNTVGSRFLVDPELFRRHLDFLRLKDFFDLPALPSSSKNIICLNITIIYKRSHALRHSEVKDGRSEEFKVVKKHQRHLGLDGIVGESIVRRYSIHDENTFTIEQQVTCYIKKSKNNWTGMFTPTNYFFKCC